MTPNQRLSKHPLLVNHAEYCDRLPALEVALWWDLLPDDYNISIACGPINNLMVVDIDTNDQSILDRCPDSPLKRKGEKGEARFFQYNSEIKNQCIGKYPKAIDILSRTRQCTIPPSIHPNTLKHYFWMNQNNLENFKLSELPLLTHEHIRQMRAIYE